MEAVTLADYQRSVLRTAFRSAVARDEARPFTLLACFVPTIVVPAVFIAVAGRHTALRPLRYVLAAALVAFQVNQLTPLWNTDGSWTRISSLNFACAYGAGISISWGTMWALNVLVWTNPWNGERVARRTRRGPPETGPDGIMDTAEAPDEDIARSLRLGHEYYWQSFPVHASFMARIDWAIDLCFAWRGVGELHRLSTFVSDLGSLLTLLLYRLELVQNARASFCTAYTASHERACTPVKHTRKYPAWLLPPSHLGFILPVPSGHIRRQLSGARRLCRDHD